MFVNIEQQISNYSEKAEVKDQSIRNMEEHMGFLQEFLNVINNDVTLESYDCLKVIECVPHLHKVKFSFNGVVYNWDMQMSAYSNMNCNYKEKKALTSKLLRAEDVLRSTKKTEKYKKTDDVAIHVTVNGKSKDNWFEEFNWFITSDGLLFISGKTADQNEKIVKKHMEKDDIYIHSEVFGSGSGVLKNGYNFLTASNEHIKIDEVCPKSLEESGNFLICHTKSWKTAPDRSYWVYPNQVSKTTEPGEFISKGAFIIRGTKNFIAVQKLELGFGILFKTKSGILCSSCSDDIEYAFPVMGTYSALLNYKFKIKVTPGTQKIKKILQDVFRTFYSKSNPYERAGIKKISDSEYQRVLVSGVKFHL
jgi:predicted ribosome quality control (RQC) complex YloA/Tae2 family protein